jgi:hypothetical protein
MLTYLHPTCIITKQPKIHLTTLFCYVLFCYVSPIYCTTAVQYYIRLKVELLLL